MSSCEKYATRIVALEIFDVYVQMIRRHTITGTLRPFHDHHCTL
jgi:hypothetical protein